MNTFNHTKIVNLKKLKNTIHEIVSDIIITYTSSIIIGEYKLRFTVAYLIIIS